MKRNQFYILLALSVIALFATSCKPTTVVTVETTPQEKTDTLKTTTVDTTETSTKFGTGVYTNDRFHDVKVVKTGNHEFKVTGKAQVFEAAFSWVVEDGHNELASGHTMTDAGAPEWGNFNFTFSAEKEQEYTTLILILYEASAKDGSRQYELPIPLE